MSKSSLIPGAFYWASSADHFDGRLTVVQVSTVFGEDPDYWTLALVGTDQHAMIGDFEILEQIRSLHLFPQLAAE
ncbi:MULTISPECIES: hypothetical protein [Rhizobium]|uniref:hypothetical protein n=1 Tax=Rhizobium TaxID=379 RepID=UPI0013BDDFA5|nr:MULTISPECIES: hypothetical protein [Rhizobium]MBY3321475.1 hypothetical protein [Rhizobium laguerreae]MBY3362811.1 hypothetical protein [Rhizobium laguerreae]MCA2436627.1 hypothetical protein [Rhizobium leguminosarum]NEH73528.1 hypothetical protein [Rhizobium leguminosarum]NKM67610.1 hypothetical protein [Rhizobium laguerreae]